MEARPSASLLKCSGTPHGTTSQGKVLYGKGTVFSMSPGGEEKILHSFGYGSEGATPLAGLIDVNETLDYDVSGQRRTAMEPPLR